MREVAFLTAINEAFHEEFQRDPTVFMMGENVSKAGGYFRDSVGLAEKFGISRVLDTPI